LASIGTSGIPYVLVLVLTQQLRFSHDGWQNAGHAERLWKGYLLGLSSGGKELTGNGINARRVLLTLCFWMLGGVRSGSFSAAKTTLTRRRYHSIVRTGHRS